MNRLDKEVLALDLTAEIKVKQAVILAAGVKKDFQHPVCLLEFGGKTLLQRNIEILEKYGIENIVIVTGYQNHAFEKVSAIVYNPNVTFVANPKYEWTGSMASLATADDYLDDDFVLLEDDILIEEPVIAGLLHQKERDCVLLTKESGSKDEVFVEIRDGHLHKISKDIHQLNRIDGEMIGVTKISKPVFDKMISVFKDNKNPYINYEYLLLDVWKEFGHSGLLKVTELIWAEIDNQAQYDKVADKIFPMLQRKEAEFRELELKQLISDALQIERNRIREVKPFGGMTNKNYLVSIDQEEFVVRIAGNGTEKMINRLEEKLNAEIGCQLGINADQVYFNEVTGLKISKLIPDAETLNAKTARREDYFSKVAAIFRKLHQSDAHMVNRFDVFEKLLRYEQFTKEANGQFFEDYEQTRAQLMELKALYDEMDFELTPCHIDPVPENFIKSGEDKIYLIDWEYSGMNDPMWDIGAFLLECEFSPSEETLFLIYYLEGNVSVDVQKRVLLNKIFQDFLWSVWTLLKEATGDDFGLYGINRYNRAKANMKEYHERFTVPV